jgi:tetratricopeptide (TPR) repeat protein
LCGAADPERQQKDFAAANERALGGDVKGAIALYEHLASEGVKNEDLFFNLGNAYAEAGRLVDAVVAYERALRLAPADEDVRANLDVVRGKLRPKNRGPQEDRAAAAADTDPVDLSDWIEPIVGPLPGNLFAWTAVIANAMVFGLLLLRRWTDREGQRRVTGLGVALSLALLLVSGLVVLGQGLAASERRAVVIQAGAAKAGPHPKYGDGPRLETGERVRILETQGDWLQVRSRQGSTGWLPKSRLELI